MNSFCTSVVLIAGLVGVALAKGPVGHGIGRIHPHIEHEEAELEPFLHHGHFRSPLGHLSDEHLLEELRFRGHHGLGGLGSGFGHGHHGFSRGGLRRRSGIGRRAGLGGAGLGGGLGGAALGGGALGGLEGAKGSVGAIGGAAHQSAHGSLENAKGGLAANAKILNAGHHENIRNENEGLHKHQVFNNDKLIVKDHTSGVNDVDGFRTATGASEGGHITAGSGNLLAGGELNRIEGGEEMDGEIGAIGASGSEIAAGGAAGGAAGAGGAIGGAKV